MYKTGKMGVDVDLITPATTGISMINTTLEPSTSVGDLTVRQVSLSYAIPVGFILSSIILATAAGNLLVVTAVIRERHLHTLANRLVASLAVTDMLVGIIVLPLAAANVIVESWPFGPVVCDFFITTDVLLCTNSILHLVAISIDRYWTVTDITYTRGNTKQQYFFPVMVTASWLMSVAVCLPPFFGWRTQREKTDNHCMISQDLGYTIYSTVTAFYLPLLIIIIVYTRIFLVVRTRVRRKQFKSSGSAKSHTNGTSTEQDKSLLTNSGGESETRKCHADNDTHQEAIDSTENSSNVGSVTSQQMAYDSVVEHSPNSKTPIKTMLKGKKCQKTYFSNSKLNDSPKKSRKKIALKRERKALRTLLMITGIFISCWLPFFIRALVMPFCGDWCINHMPKLMDDIITWLGYSNSMLNPIIYTIFSPDFRLAFRKILSGH